MYVGTCNSDLRACGQPHTASLQVVGLIVLGFAVWAATHGFIASCRSGCLGFAVWAATRGFFASCRSSCPGSCRGVWAATRGFIASCRSACLSPTRGLLLYVNLAGPSCPALAWLQLRWNPVYMHRACLCCRLVGRVALLGRAAPEYASQGFQRRIGSAIPRPLRLYAGSPQCAALVQGEG